MANIVNDLEACGFKRMSRDVSGLVSNAELLETFSRLDKSGEWLPLARAIFPCVHDVYVRVMDKRQRRSAKELTRTVSNAISLVLGPEKRASQEADLVKVLKVSASEALICCKKLEEIEAKTEDDLLRTGKKNFFLLQPTARCPGYVRVLLGVDGYDILPIEEWIAHAAVAGLYPISKPVALENGSIVGVSLEFLTFPSLRVETKEIIPMFSRGFVLVPLAFKCQEYALGNLERASRSLPSVSAAGTSEFVDKLCLLLLGEKGVFTSGGSLAVPRCMFDFWCMDFKSVLERADVSEMTKSLLTEVRRFFAVTAPNRIVECMFALLVGRVALWVGSGGGLELVKSSWLRSWCKAAVKAFGTEAFADLLARVEELSEVELFAPLLRDFNPNDGPREYSMQLVKSLSSKAQLRKCAFEIKRAIDHVLVKHDRPSSVVFFGCDEQMVSFVIDSATTKRQSQPLTFVVFAAEEEEKFSERQNVVFHDVSDSKSVLQSLKENGSVLCVAHLAGSSMTYSSLFETVLSSVCRDAIVLACHGAGFWENGFGVQDMPLFPQRPSAAALVETAAEFAWFSKKTDVGSGQRYSVTRFVQKSFCVRKVAFQQDCQVLVHLESFWSNRTLSVSAETLEARVRTYPEGQWVLEVNGKIVAVLYSQPIDSIDCFRETPCGTPNVDSSGKILQLIAALSDPVAADIQPANTIINFVLGLAPLRGFDAVVAVTRFSGYAVWKSSHPALSIDDYLRSDSDPTVCWHKSRGATVDGIVRGFRAEDVENEGTGVLVVYKLSQSEPDEVLPQSAPTKTGQMSKHDVMRTLEDIIAKILEKNGEPFDVDASFFALGLGSLELFEFRKAIGERLGFLGDVTMFFEHSSIKALAEYLCGDSGSADLALTSASSGRRVFVTGFSCNVAGLQQVMFARSVAVGSDMIRPAPASRFELRDLDFEGGFLDQEDVWTFDCNFWKLSQREARVMDPQQRLLLEHVWHALESGSVVASDVKSGDYGVVVGLWNVDFKGFLGGLKSDAIYDVHSATGTSSSVAAGRISYIFGITGPSLVVDTACSSGLVAVSVAMKSVLGDVTKCIVGACNVILSPMMHKQFQAAGFLSPDCRCKTFDASANGYVRSEACVTVLLSLNIVDGEETSEILAGVVNQDGRSGGLTVPNRGSQMRLLKRGMMEAAKTDTEAVSLDWFECHGTGTSLGDPIEAAAIMSSKKSSSRMCIGSLKGNVGHTEAASGLVGLMRCLFDLPPSRQVHFSNLNAHIGSQALEANSCVIPVEGLQGDPRCFAVSSFGFSGTNAHCVLRRGRRAGGKDVGTCSDKNGPIWICAKTESSLRLMSLRYSECVAERGWDMQPVNTDLQFRVQIRGKQDIVTGGSRSSSLPTPVSSLRYVFDRANVNPVTAQSCNAYSVVWEAHSAVWQPFFKFKAVIECRSVLLSHSLQKSLKRFIDEGEKKVLGLFAGFELDTVTTMISCIAFLERFEKDYPRGGSAFILTSFAVSVMGNAITEGQCALWGLCRCARLEFGQTRVQNVDLDSLQCLESVNWEDSFSEVAYRQGSCYHAALSRVTRPVRNRSVGRCVLTGGFGQIAEVCCSWALSRGGTELVRVGRSGATELHFAQLVVPRVNSYCIRADLSNLSDVKGSFSLFPHCSALFHLSGTFTTSLLKDVKRQTIVSSFRSKLGPLRHLKACGLLSTFKSMFLFSSQASILPVVGQGVYAAANSALDSFAEKGRGFVIALGAFSGGMYDKVDLRQRKLEESYWRTISASEVKMALDSCDDGSFLFAEINWDAVAAMLPNGGNIFHSLCSTEHEVQLRATETGKGKAEAGLVDVGRVVRQVLMMPDGATIDEERPFTDLGFDSILSVELSRELQHHGFHVTMTVAYDYPSLAALRKHLAKEVLPVQEPLLPASRASALFLGGMSCRFGSAYDLDALWELLLAGVDMVSLVPPMRWKWEDWGGGSWKWGCFVEGLDMFDASFFNISPREARLMDPQQRLLLECAWESLEGSDLDPLGVRNEHVGAFVGIQGCEYAFRLRGEEPDALRATSCAVSIAAGRLSYVFGLLGESLAIDTACSSALVALIHAARSVEFGFSKSALFLGVNALINPHAFADLGRAGMLSPSGRCRTFDSHADGYVRAEGCGSGLVQSESGSASLVVRGHAVNQDGRSNGLTAPNGPSQVKLLRAAGGHENVDVYEAHGTGTSLGDPIEVQALVSVCAGRGDPLILGAAKTNFGHSESASGMLGLLKIFVCALHEKVPRHLHLTNLNEFIGSGTLETARSVVAMEPACWKNGRGAAVSAFGYSGTNAHVVVSCSAASHVLQASEIVHIYQASAEKLRILASKLSSFAVYGREEEFVSSLSSAALRGRKSPHCVIVRGSRQNVRDECRKAAGSVHFPRVQQSLPFSPFERKSFWEEAQPKKDGDMQFRLLLHRDTCYKISDHQVYGVDVMPGAAHASLVIDQCRKAYGWTELTLFEVEFLMAVVVDPSTELLYAHKRRERRIEFNVSAGEVVHATGNARSGIDTKFHSENLVDSRVFQGLPSIKDDLEGVMERVQVLRGPAFRWLVSWQRFEDACCALFYPPSTWEKTDLAIPGEVLDSIYLTGLPFFDSDMFFAPFGFRSLQFAQPFDQTSESVVFTRHLAKRDNFASQSSEMAQHGRKILALSEFMMVKASQNAFLSHRQTSNLLYEIRWISSQGVKRQTSVLEIGAYQCEMLKKCLVEDVTRVKVLFYSTLVEIGPQLVCLNGVGLLREARGREKLRLEFDFFRFFAERGVSSTLYCLHSGAQRVLMGDPVLPVSRALWSFARCFSLESSDVCVVLLDLDSSALRSVLREVCELAPENSSEVCLRSGSRWIGRLEHIKDWPTLEDGGYKLSFSKRGQLSYLKFVPADDVTPSGSNWVQVRVQASALNFRDVLNVLDMYPGDCGDVGSDLSGIVTASVSFPIGSRVFGLAKTWGSFSSAVYTTSDLVVELPQECSFEEAATMPTIFCTALACMDEFAHTTSFHSWLIHACAGGVGLAALQLAKNVFNVRNLYGTAGTTEKRLVARRWGCDFVSDSRVLGFAEHVLSSTGGYGVDFLLNSLGRNFEESSMHALAECGCWAEIGKRGIQSVDEFRSRKSLGKFLVYDLGVDMDRGEQRLQNMLARIVAWWKKGLIRAVPHQKFPVRKAKEAFQFMFDGHHIGKIVFCHPRSVSDFASRCVMIVGAFGGLGVLVAAWTSRFARASLLIGRSSNLDASLWQSWGATQSVCHVMVDARQSESFATSCFELVQCIGVRPYLVLHLVGVVSDALVRNVTNPSTWLGKCLAPKVGTMRSLVRMPWIFDAVTFTFSSIASLAGNLGQANYAAGNGFLDGFAEKNADSFVSINWGAWDTGMYGRMDERLKDHVSVLHSKEAADLLAIAAAARGAVGLFRVDWDQNTTQSRFLTSHLKRTETEKVTVSSERAEQLLNSIAKSVLGFDDAMELDEETPLVNFGFDSMLSVEFRRRVVELFRIDLPATLLFDFPTLKKVKARVLAELVRSDQEKDKLVIEKDLFTGNCSSMSVSGCSCRFGSSWALEDLWNEFYKGSDMVRAVPPGSSRSLEEGTMAGFFDGLELFDASFFMISPREAIAMDPQHRILLECAWDCIESSGISPLVLEGQDVGVYVGISVCDYINVLSSELEFGATGIITSPAAGRVSYLFSLTGPAVSLDTACSSSLVALTYACKQEERDMNLSFGVNALCSMVYFTAFGSAGMLSPDGRCKTFDSRANGYVRAEGCGGIFLTRQVRDVRVSSCLVNQDGRSNGLTAPNGPAQVVLLKQAWQTVDLSNMAAVEVHGTGTALGDPIEARALVEALNKDGTPTVLQTAKTNLGHAEAAAGVLGVFHVLLSGLRNVYPKSLHLSSLNEHIGAGLLEQGKCVISQENIHMHNKTDKTLFGVSSFGFSGTNAHVVLECAVQSEKVSTSDDWSLTVCGPTQEACRDLAKVYADFVIRNGPLAVEMMSMCNHRERSFKWRSLVEGANRKCLVEKLRAQKNFEFSQIRKDSNVSEPALPAFHVQVGHVNFERKIFWKDGGLIPAFSRDTSASPVSASRWTVGKPVWTSDWTEPVVIIGAGFQGIAAARFFQKRGIKCVVLEKQAELGGCWVTFGNAFSCAQTESATYHLDIEAEDADDFISNFTPRDELMAYTKECVTRWGLRGCLRFGCEVTDVVDQNSHVNVYYREKGIECIQRASRVVVVSGRLTMQKEVVFAGEDCFGFPILYGTGDKVSAGDLRGRDVVIIGHGAFALELVRTAIENGANKITLLCRKKNAVLPRAGSWAINASSDPLSLRSLRDIMSVGYALLNEDPPGFADQAGLTPVSDLYFLARYYGKLEVIEDEVANFRPGLVVTRGGRDLRSNFCIKCLGFVADHRMDAILRLKTLNGLWVNGSPRISFHREGRGSKGVVSVDSTTAMVLLQRSLHAILFSFEHPDDMAHVMDALPKVDTTSDFGAFYLGMTFAVLQSKVSSLKTAFERVLEKKTLLTRCTLEKFHRECSQDWEKFHTILSPDTPCPPYLFTAPTCLTLFTTKPLDGVCVLGQHILRPEIEKYLGERCAASEKARMAVIVASSWSDVKGVRACLEESDVAQFLVVCGAASEQGDDKISFAKLKGLVKYLCLNKDSNYTFVELAELHRLDALKVCIEDFLCGRFVNAERKWNGETWVSRNRATTDAPRSVESFEPLVLQDFPVKLLQHVFAVRNRRRIIGCCVGQSSVGLVGCKVSCIGWGARCTIRHLVCANVVVVAKDRKDLSLEDMVKVEFLHAFAKTPTIVELNELTPDLVEPINVSILAERGYVVSAKAEEVTDSASTRRHRLFDGEEFDAIVKEVLGLSVDQVLDEGAELKDIGLDSMLSAELVAKLGQGLGEDIALSALLDCTSVKALKTYVLSLPRGRDETVEFMNVSRFKKPGFPRLVFVSGFGLLAKTSMTFINNARLHYEVLALEFVSSRPVPDIMNRLLESLSAEEIGGISVAAAHSAGGMYLLEFTKLLVAKGVTPMVFMMDCQLPPIIEKLSDDEKLAAIMMPFEMMAGQASTCPAQYRFGALFELLSKFFPEDRALFIAKCYRANFPKMVANFNSWTIHWKCALDWIFVRATTSPVWQVDVWRDKFTSAPRVVESSFDHFAMLRDSMTLFQNELLRVKSTVSRINCE